MPLYSYICPAHGSFDLIESLTAVQDRFQRRCPGCGEIAVRSMTVPARISVKTKERLPYGSGSRGRYIPSEETGGMGILVPSWGSMEKEEVEYVAQMALQKEKERQKTPRQTVTKARLGALVNLAYKTKQGQRAKTIKEAMKDTIGHIK